MSMEPLKKRAKTLDAETNGDCHDDEQASSSSLVRDCAGFSPSLLSSLMLRMSQLEESHHKQVSELNAQVVGLQERVKELEREAIRAEDGRNYDSVGRLRFSPTIHAARRGETSVLAERLRRGADPNQIDNGNISCLMHAALKARPECTRLLIDHGANVRYCCPDDNSSVLILLVQSFADEGPYYNFRQGDFVLIADLLVEAGAPIHEVTDENGEANTALGLLHSMREREGTKRSRERSGLIAVLEGRYWQTPSRTNPFLRVSPDEAAWLLLKGAADDENDGHIDITRVRSIRPDARQAVADALTRFVGMRETFVHAILTMQDPNGVSPFCALRGHESTILPVTAAFAGGSGWSRRKLNEARTLLHDAILQFNEDGSERGDGEDNEGDGEGDDDDSYEVGDDDEDDDNDDEHGRRLRHEEFMDMFDPSSSTDGDY